MQNYALKLRKNRQINSRKIHSEESYKFELPAHLKSEFNLTHFQIYRINQSQ